MIRCGAPIAGIFRAAAAVLLGLATAAAWAAPAHDALHRGQQAMDKGDFDQAVRQLTEALRLDPKCSEAYQARGWVYAEQGELAQAVADYSEALRLQPQSAETWCNRGDAYAKLGEPARALADLQRAIELAPKLVEARLVRAYVYVDREEFDKALADYSEALRLAPDNAHAHVQRANCFLAKKQYQPAIADLDVVLRLEPKNVPAWGARGSARLSLGDYRGGIADLETAVRLNPHDAGANYQPWAKTPVGEDVLKHGRKQVRRMVKSRPVMGREIAPDDVPWQWVERRFAGEGLGSPLNWDPAPPTDSEAEHVAPAHGRHGRVRVAATWLTGPRAGKVRKFEALWANVIFELHNFAFVKEFVRLHEEAGAGKLAKEQFVAGILKYEYQAAQQTRAFYLQVYLPWAEKKRLPTDPTLWFTNWWDDPEEALHGFLDKASYPWRPYARQYDWLTVQRLWEQDKYREAAALLETMRAEKQYTEDKAQVLLWLGRCRLEAELPDGAIEALGESLQLDPRNAEAYALRGEAYQQKGDKAKAEADVAKARQLETAKPK